MSLGGARDLLASATALYIVVSPTARTDASWPPRGYAGPSGRLDVVARAAVASLSIERAAAFAGLLLGPPRPPVAVLASGECVEAAGGERGVMEAFRRLLMGRRVGGCMALPWGAERLLHEARRLGFRVYTLEEGGADVSRVPGALRGRAAFLAGAHLDPPPGVLALARRLSEARVSVGPRSLLTSHVLAFLAALRVSGSA